MDQCISDIDNKAKQELQVTVISSKLAIKDIFHQKCVYMLNDFFDDRKNQKCVQVTESSWFVWKFEVEEPYFGKDADYLVQNSKCFANVYEVKVKQQANQSFLKCDCLHYERCGMPCTYIMKTTNEIYETIIYRNCDVLPLCLGDLLNHTK